MAPTTLQTILDLHVRPALIEPTARFWSDAELLAIMRGGILDLWGAILDVHGDHYLTVDETNVSLLANGTQLSGVPVDCFRVQSIEPRDISPTGNSRGLIFLPRKFKDADFTGARSRPAQNAWGGGVIYYQLTGQGAPASPPVILTAPAVNATIPLRLAYNPTLDIPATGAAINPIPGEADTAVKAWTIAYARAKEREDRMPDPAWLATYASERSRLLTRLTPRQEQEPDVVEDFF